MADKVDLSNYITVADRLNAFYIEKFPDGRLSADEPVVIEVGGKTFIQVRAHAWRAPDDPLPATATAWEPFPGTTNFTRDSEMMNAETSALGRVLAMCGVEVRADIASANEVRHRQEEATRRAEDVNPDAPVGVAQGMFFIRFAKNQRGLTDEEIEALVLETTEGRTAEVGGVLVGEWGRLRDLAADFYRQRSGMRPLPPAGATPDGSGQVQDAGPDVRVLDVPGQVADEGLKTPAELGSRKRGK